MYRKGIHSIRYIPTIARREIFTRNCDTKKYITAVLLILSCLCIKQFLFFFEEMCGRRMPKQTPVIPICFLLYAMQF